MIPCLEMLMGLRWQLRKDDNLLRRALFSAYLQRRPVLSPLYALLDCWGGHGLRRLACLAFFYLNLCRFRFPTETEVVAALQIKSEFLAFEETVLPHNRNRIGIARTSFFFALLQAVNVRNVGLVIKLGRSKRLLAGLTRARPLFVALRAVAYLACFVKFKAWILDPQIRSVVVFTDGNPHGIALFHVARCLRKPIFFVAHGEAGIPTFPIHCNGAFLWGKESYQRYLDAGAKIGSAVFRGQKDVFKPIRFIHSKVRRVGIFLSKLTRIPTIMGVVKDVVDWFRPETIVIRPHPNFALTAGMERELQKRPEIRIGGDLNILEEAHSVDLVLAGNTTAHPQVLLSGTPSLYCYSLESIDFDRNGYVRRGLLLEWETRPTVRQINDFYGRSEHLIILSEHVELALTLKDSIEHINELVFQQ